MTLTSELTPAEQRRNQLVLEHLAFVRRVAEKLKLALPSAVFDVEDLYQEGAIGLIQAASKYDSARNDKFQGYAYPRVRGAMLDSLRRRHWRHLTQPQLLDGAEAPPEPEVSSEVEREIEREQRAEALGRVERAALEIREQTIVDLYYRSEQTEAQIAPLLQMSESRVGQIRRGALVKLRRRCTLMGLAA